MAEQYRQCIRKLLTEQAMMEAGNPDIECQLIFDAEHDHYQLLDVGWLGLKRIYNCFIHFGNFLTLTGLAHRTYACRIQTRRL